MLVYTYMNVYLFDCIGGFTFYASDQSQGILSHSDSGINYSTCIGQRNVIKHDTTGGEKNSCAL